MCTAIKTGSFVSHVIYIPIVSRKIVLIENVVKHCNQKHQCNRMNLNALFIEIDNLLNILLNTRLQYKW